MKKYLLSLGLSLALASSALAGTVTVAWDFTHDAAVATTRFKLNFNPNCGNATTTTVVPVAAPSGTFTQQYTTTTLATNTVYCLTVLAMTEAGVESRTTSILRFQTK